MWRACMLLCLGLVASGLSLDLPNYWNTVDEYDNITATGPTTVQEIEAILAYSTEITAFLNTFDNIEHRYIIRDQLKYCPFTGLCGLFDSDSNDSEWSKLCWDCSCDTSCSRYGTCCPDIVDPDLLDFDVYEMASMYEGQKETCIAPVLRQPLIHFSPDNVGIMAVVKCPVDTDENIRALCTEEYKFGQLELSDIVLVTHRITHKTYRNQHCAICNGVSTHTLVYWKAFVQCTYGNLEFSSEAEMINQILLPGICNMKYENDQTPNTAQNSCPMIISRCNVTGHWHTYNETVEKACSLYASTYAVIDDYYRNVFCAICNGCYIHTVVLEDIDMSYDIPSVSFTMLLDSSPQKHQEQRASTSACAPENIYDPIKETCTGLRCFWLSWLQNNTCVPLTTISTYMVYAWYIRLVPTDKITMSGSYGAARNFSSAIADDILPALSQTMSLTMKLCSIRMLYKVNGSISTLNSTENWMYANVLYYDIQLVVAITNDHDVNVAVRSLLSIVSLNISAEKEFGFQLCVIDNLNSTMFDEVANMSRSHVDIPHTDHPPSWIVNHIIPDTSDNTTIVPYIEADGGMNWWCDRGYRRVKVIHMTVSSCPLVVLQKEDYIWTITDDGLYLQHIGQFIANSDFHFNIYDREIFICADVYSSLVNEYMNRTIAIGSVNAETVLTFAGLCISLICLLLTFTTFCSFPKLRTLPGKNTMSLVACLFFAQLLFLVGGYGGLGTATCQIIGLLLHLFWLLALMWMNVCTFHMFRTFSRPLQMRSSGSGWKLFLLYHAYCMSLSLAFVAANISLTLIKSDMSDIGYGGRACYISSPSNVLYTFTVPVAIVVLSNIGMFLYTLIKIKLQPTIDSTVRHNRNNLKIFAKLSTLTGITWLFGLIHDWTGNIAFAYLFIVLNATQGLFLAVAFICNRRVLDMYRGHVSEGFVTYFTRSTRSTLDSTH